VKYWVYQDSRILGPFDKDAFSGLPGVDSYTLVSAGDAAASGEGEWRPASEIPDLAGVSLKRGVAWSPEDPLSTYGLLDRLQIESSGPIDDEDFPGATESLFSDAPLNKDFSDLLLPQSAAAEAELRRSKGRVSQLTAQLELLYMRVSELESSESDLAHRLAEKEIALRLKTPAQSLMPVAAPLSIMPPAAVSLVPPVAAPLTPPAEASFMPPAAAPLVPPVAAPLTPPAEASFMPPAAASLTPPAEASFMPPAAASLVPPAEASFVSLDAVPFAPPGLCQEWSKELPVGVVPSSPTIASAAPTQLAATPPAEAPSAVVPSPPASAPPSLADAVATAPEKASTKAAFPKPKHFKVVPTIRSFRVVGPDDGAAPSAPVSAPAVEAPADISSVSPPATIPETAMPILTPVSELASISLQSRAPETTAVPVPAAESAAPPPSMVALGEMMQPESATAPASVPIAASAFGFEDMACAPSPAQPPATLAFSGVFEAAPTPAGVPSEQDVLSRLAKPAPAAPTVSSRSVRSNKPFLFAAAALVALLGVIGYFMLRQPKDLKQMASLDDGREHLGAQPVDEPSRTPSIKPSMTAPTPAVEPASPPTVQPEASTELDAVMALVKDFPLDGGRGTVSQWLQYSYNASPDAGKETWSASGAGGQTYLVEYRFVPSARVGAEVHYLFTGDMSMGLVFGKNLEAQRLLAGSAPRVEEEKPKARSKVKTFSRPATKNSAKRSALDAAVALVKDFPLDGGRGTVARWLQYSHNADADAGKEIWSASGAGGQTYRVEYRFVPSARGGAEIQYLFAGDMSMGLVFGKNPKAQRLLAGRAPRVARKDAAGEAPKDLPALSLPNESELNSPAEDDDSFGSDTVNTGL